MPKASRLELQAQHQFCLPARLGLHLLISYMRQKIRCWTSVRFCKGWTFERNIGVPKSHM